jgi:hypothetical protein
LDSQQFILFINQRCTLLLLSYRLVQVSLKLASKQAHIKHTSNTHQTHMKHTQGVSVIFV